MPTYIYTFDYFLGVNFKYRKLQFENGCPSCHHNYNSVYINGIGSRTLKCDTFL